MLVWNGFSIPSPLLLFSSVCSHNVARNNVLSVYSNHLLSVSFLYLSDLLLDIFLAMINGNTKARDRHTSLDFDAILPAKRSIHKLNEWHRRLHDFTAARESPEIGL